MAESSHRANHFELSDEQVTIVYDETILNGQPQVTYQEELGEEVQIFRGDEIQIQNNLLGSQITVTLENIPDRETIFLTLFIPEIHLRNIAEYRFETIALETTVRSSLLDPRGVQGALQSYNVLELEGIARRILA